MSDEKVDAWMPLWIGAYLADTMHLSRDSHGGYLLLLFAYWRNKGPLPDDDEDLAGITKATPQEWKKLRPRLAKFFDIEDGVWRHGRADKELTKAGLLKAAAVSKAKAGAQARWEKHRKQAPGNAPSIAQALPEQCPTPTPLIQEQGRATSRPTPLPGPPPPCARALVGPEPRTAEQPLPDGEPTPAGLACRAIKAAGIMQVNPGSPDLKRLLDAGVTAQELADTAVELVGKGKGRWALLLSTVEGRRIDAAQRGALPTAPEVPWHSTRQGIEAKGEELGIGRWDEAAFNASLSAHQSTERGFNAYEARVRKVADALQGQPV